MASECKAWRSEVDRKNLQRARRRKRQRGRASQRGEDIKQATEDTMLNISGECGNRRIGRQLSALARAISTWSQVQKPDWRSPRRRQG